MTAGVPDWLLPLPRAVSQPLCSDHSTVFNDREMHIAAAVRGSRTSLELANGVMSYCYWVCCAWLLASPAARHGEASSANRATVTSLLPSTREARDTQDPTGERK
jgi:hypothetical protein